MLQLYCIGDGADTITLRYSPHPCLGPFREAVITPAAAWAWQPLVIEEMWDYDSLFIWVYECEANVDWAYDAEEPYDGHESGDAGATWADMAIRPFIRVVYTGETPGDVPVSGIVNTVKVPAVGARQETAFLAVPNAAWTPLLTVEGAGTLIQARIVFVTAVAPAAGIIYAMRIYVAGVEAFYIDNILATQSDIATAGRAGNAEFVQIPLNTLLQVRVPLEFRRLIQIEGYQSSGAGCNATVYLTANLNR